MVAVASISSAAALSSAGLSVSPGSPGARPAAPPSKDVEVPPLLVRGPHSDRLHHQQRRGSSRTQTWTPPDRRRRRRRLLLLCRRCRCPRCCCRRCRRCWLVCCALHARAPCRSSRPLALCPSSSKPPLPPPSLLLPPAASVACEGCRSGARL